MWTTHAHKLWSALGSFSTLTLDIPILAAIMMLTICFPLTYSYQFYSISYFLWVHMCACGCECVSRCHRIDIFVWQHLPIPWAAFYHDMNFVCFSLCSQLKMLWSTIQGNIMSILWKFIHCLRSSLCERKRVCVRIKETESFCYCYIII